MLKYYMETMYPGVFLGESSIVEVNDIHVENVKLPERAIGFRFFSKTIAQLDGEELCSPPKNYSGWYYKGEEFTLDRVKREKPNETILISNMECNHWDRIVMFPNGQCYNLNDEDTVI